MRLHVLPGSNGITVDGCDAVAALQCGEGCRSPGQAADKDRVDLGCRSRGIPDRNAKARVDRKRENHIHRDARQDHCHPRPQRLLVERACRIDRHVGLATFELARHSFFFEAGHLHVPAERDPRNPVFRLAPAPGDQWLSKSQRKAQHLNAHCFRDDEMPKFVHRDEHTEYDDERRDRQEHAASRARRRASASAASTTSSEVASPRCGVAFVTRSMISAMRPKGMRSSRKSCTAISLAALKRAGAVPPSRAASRPTTYAGKRSGCTASNVSVPAATGSKRRTP